MYTHNQKLGTVCSPKTADMGHVFGVDQGSHDGTFNNQGTSTTSRSLSGTLRRDQAPAGLS